MIESGPAPDFTPDSPQPPLGLPAETTGRFVVVFADDVEDAADVLESSAGVSGVASAQELGGEDETPTTTDTVFENLGMAVVSADPDQVGALQSGQRTAGRVLAVVPELVHHVREGSYLQGYVDGVRDLGARLGTQASPLPPAAGTTPPAAGGAPAVQAFQDTATATWGIQATGADISTASGKGIRVAVLDTGFDSSHPDFTGRRITERSFITGEDTQDAHGHGTHCIGTACGPKSPAGGRRYGVAYAADIYVGKVLSNAGSGTDGGILAGMDWAIRSGCAVISMSLGADVPRTHPPYTVAGRRALDRGSLVVAAAGNNAMRTEQNFGFVGVPANSPCILAVGALTHHLDVAYFSARTLQDVQGGQLDLAAPGYQVYSSWPMPTRYRSISGTSMATPHVAGLAALFAQTTGYRGWKLWTVLVQESRRLMAPSLDVGAGLARAPRT